MMKLGELKDMIEFLENMEGEDVLDMEVMAVHDYGDHCHTQALVDFKSADVVKPQKSAYSDTGLAMPSEYDDEGTEPPIVALH
jgi:hypothetical protein